MDNRAEESPTTFAAKLISEGHTPDEVKHIMESRNMNYPTVANVLNEFMSTKNCPIDEIAERSGISAVQINRIMNEQRNPSRNMLLRIAMALGLSVEETQVLLKSGNCAPLSAMRERDLIIMDAIINGKNYDSVNEALETKNMPVLKESYKYCAFISYSHKDKEIAQKLQKRLEEYHLPSDLQKTHPDLPENLTPVFIDESNLVATGTLKEALQKNLENSKYLIVICSPNSAKSPYVNDEVEYFIRKGRIGNIIPLIVDGVPHSEDDAQECFPRAILNLPRDQELLGIDMKTFGEHDAFLRVIATMLGLEIDELVSGNVITNKTMIFTLTAAFLVMIAVILIWYILN